MNDRFYEWFRSTGYQRFLADGGYLRPAVCGFALSALASREVART
jgi:hypothetical protein